MVTATTKEQALVPQSLPHFFSVFHLLVPFPGIIKILSKLEIEENFLHLQKSIQGKLADNSMSNCKRSNIFHLRARLRQEYLTNSIQHCTRCYRKCNKVRKVKVIHIKKQGIKVLLFSDGMLFYIKKSYGIKNK